VLVDADRAGEPGAQQFWSELLQAIDNDAEVILAQLDAARDEYPELTSACGLLLSYVHFVHGMVIGLTPVPPGPLPIPLEFPQEICRKNRLICNCAHGDVGACKALGVYAEQPTALLTCEQLWERYRVALQQAIDALGAAGPYVFEEGELRRTDRNVRAAWLELIAGGCIELPAELGGLPTS
jgi:hypothetical protein